MAKHNIQGQVGENKASEFLIHKGYQILHRNWRYGHKELDIVAQKEDTVIFVEVKTRRNTLFGFPQDAVNEKKIRRIISSADAYIKYYKIDNPIRFDIISIITDEDNEMIEHIEDAFFSPIW